MTRALFLLWSLVTVAIGGAGFVAGETQPHACNVAVCAGGASLAPSTPGGRP